MKPITAVLGIFFVGNLAGLLAEHASLARKNLSKLLWEPSFWETMFPYQLATGAACLAIAAWWTFRSEYRSTQYSPTALTIGAPSEEVHYLFISLPVLCELFGWERGILTNAILFAGYHVISRTDEHGFMKAVGFITRTLLRVILDVSGILLCGVLAIELPTIEVLLMGGGIYFVLMLMLRHKNTESETTYTTMLAIFGFGALMILGKAALPAVFFLGALHLGFNISLVKLLVNRR